MKRLTWAAVAALGAMTVGSSADAAVAPAVSGPMVVSMWHLDEAAGSSVMVDSSGFAHHGAISPDVGLGAPGVLGSGFDLTGNAPIVRVPTADDLNPYSAPLTISAYVNVPTNLSAGDYNLLEKGTATALGGAYKLEVVGNTTSARFGYPDCAFNSPGGLKNRVYGPKRLTDSTYHRVECHLTSTQAYVTTDGVSGPPPGA